MGHKFVNYDGTWDMWYAKDSKDTVYRACPKCKFVQPMVTQMVGIYNFRECPRCHASLSIPKKIK